MRYLLICIVFSVTSNLWAISCENEVDKASPNRGLAMNICQEFVKGNFASGLRLLDNSTITDKASFLSGIGKSGPIAMIAAFKPVTTGTIKPVPSFPYLTTAEKMEVESIKRIITIGTQPGQGINADSNKNMLFCYNGDLELTNEAPYDRAPGKGPKQEACPSDKPSVASEYSPWLAKLTINKPWHYETKIKRLFKSTDVSSDFTPYEIALANANYLFIEAMNELRKSQTSVLFFNYQFKKLDTPAGTITKYNFVKDGSGITNRRPISTGTLNLSDFILASNNTGTNRGVTSVPSGKLNLTELDLSISQFPPVYGLGVTKEIPTTCELLPATALNYDQKRIVSLLGQLQAEQLKEKAYQNYADVVAKNAADKNAYCSIKTLDFNSEEESDKPILASFLPFKNTLAQFFPYSPDMKKYYDGPMVPIEYAAILIGTKAAATAEVNN